MRCRRRVPGALPPGPKVSCSAFCVSRPSSTITSTSPSKPTVSPRLAHRVDQLRQEHNEIALALGDCLTRLELVPNSAHADWVAARRDDCNSLLGRLVRHRQRGADLVYEAFVEVGGSD